LPKTRIDFISFLVLKQKLAEADEHLRNELSSMQSDDHRKKTEDRSKKHVEKLKATFSGVVGRISDLCKV